MTDSTIECFLNESNIIKKYTPNIPVTTNISGFIKKLDQFEMLKHMDAAGWDNYPNPTDDKSLVSLKHDIMRGLKGGKSFLLIEQSPNQQNWQPYNKLKRPGEVRLLAYQAMAHGADSCLFFQMRQSVSGMEKFHGGLISHSGRDDTRIFKECSTIGHELQKIGDAFLGGTIHAKVGILFDWNNWWAVELSSGPSKDLNYLEQVQKYYCAFYEKNIPVDILSEEADLSKYEVIVTPLLYMIKDGVTEKIENFVNNGGTLISSVFSGIVDENDKVALGGYPGKLTKILGIYIEECDALLPNEKNSMIIADSSINLQASYSCGLLCDIIHPQTAHSLASYGDDFYKGTSCFTKNQFGKGTAYYIGTDPEQAFLNDFVADICNRLKLQPIINASDNVEITTRISDKSEVTFIINHNNYSVTIPLKDYKFIDLLNDTVISEQITLTQKDVAVIKKIK